MNILRPWFAQLAVAIGALAYSVCAGAQPYPSKPILLIVPAAAGGPADGMARLVAAQLEARLRQPVLVENRPAAMGLAGFAQAAKSAPDGYTLVLGNIEMPPGAGGGGGQQLNLQKDFVPVSLLAQAPVALVVAASMPATSLKELLDYAASRPGQISHGTSGFGSTSYLAAQQFNGVTGAAIATVPYRTSPEALTALAADSVKTAVVPLGDAIADMKAGKVRGLAVSGSKRSAAAPEVPTFAETGVKGVDAVRQYAVLLPVGAPPAIVATLNEALRDIVKSADFQNLMTRYAAEAVGSSPEELATALRASQGSHQFARLITGEVAASSHAMVTTAPAPAAAPKPLAAAAPAPANLPYKVVKVFFGTDRKLNATTSAPRDFFDAERGHMISYGTCEVSIPRAHKIGELESPLALRKFFENPAKHIVLLRIDLRQRDEFMGDLDGAITQNKTNAALVFVHGYNNSFEDAARRTAQIAHDIEFTGVPMFYSWPSNGAALSYVTDGNDAEQAVVYLKEFLKDLALNSRFTSITLLAHSMGNRVLTQAFAALKNEIDATKLHAFKEIILAAPDIDADVFKNMIAPALVASKAPVTLYASSRDEALTAAKKINGGPRAGDADGGLIVFSGIETIDATNIDTNLFWGLGHAYLADSRNVLSDLSNLVVKGLRATSRYGLEPVPGPSGLPYWKFKN